MNLAPEPGEHDEFVIKAMRRVGQMPNTPPQGRAAGTAEMTTKAWAMGPSSVMVRSMRAS